MYIVDYTNASIYVDAESRLLKSQVMVVERNSVDLFSPGVEIAVIRSP